jgi:hypothetical protein
MKLCSKILLKYQQQHKKRLQIYYLRSRETSMYIKCYKMFFSWRAQKSLKTVNKNIMLTFFFRKGNNCINFKIYFTLAAHSEQNSNFKEYLQRSESREHFVNFKRQHFGQHINEGLPFH